MNPLVLLLDGEYLFRGLIETILRRRGYEARYTAVMSGSWTHETKAVASLLGSQVLQKPLSLHELQQWLNNLKGNKQGELVLAGAT